MKGKVLQTGFVWFVLVFSLVSCVSSESTDLEDDDDDNGCTSDSDCNIASEVCDLETSLCTPRGSCLGNPCPTGYNCDASTGACVVSSGSTSCTSNADCPSGQICDVATGDCIMGSDNPTDGDEDGDNATDDDDDTTDDDDDVTDDDDDEDGDSATDDDDDDEDGDSATDDDDDDEDGDSATDDDDDDEDGDSATDDDDDDTTDGDETCPGCENFVGEYCIEHMNGASCDSMNVDRLTVTDTQSDACSFMVEITFTNGNPHQTVLVDDCDFADMAVLNGTCTVSSDPNLGLLSAVCPGLCTFIFSKDATCPEPDGDEDGDSATDDDDDLDGDEDGDSATDDDDDLDGDEDGDSATDDDDDLDGDEDGDSATDDDDDDEPTCADNEFDCSGTCVEVVDLGYGEAGSATVNTCTIGENRFSSYTCDGQSGPAKEVIFRWLADRSDDMVLGTETISDWDQMIFQLSSPCTNACSQYADSEYGGSGVQEYFYFTATQGHVYYFAVDGYTSSECGSVTVGVSTESDAGCETIGPAHYGTFGLVFSALLFYGIWIFRRRKNDEA